MLHGGLLAALVFSWPAQLNPAPPNPAAVSLLIVAPQPAARQPAVQPKPPEEQITLPATPPLKIVNGAAKPGPPTTLPKAAMHAPAAKTISTAPQAVVETKTVTQQVGDGFVAAQPASGNVNQPPEYPARARAYGEQGDVLLSVHVLANGTADSVSVTQSSGYEILDEAAAKAVWKWRFQPSTLAGQPVPSVIPYQIHFTLQNAP
jgi:protein TonB